jgi:hypothetical protein
MVQRARTLEVKKLIPDKRETQSSDLAEMRECVVKGGGSSTAAVRSHVERREGNITMVTLAFSYHSH